jgi:hypothetical protein
VTVTGMAGAPTIDTVKNNKVKDSYGKVRDISSITAEISGQKYKFAIDTKNILFLNSTDYVIRYVQMGV